ncbi:MAG TPA: T9SS type A sorting domain-containing protein [Bacteroidota bacterium]
MNMAWSLNGIFTIMLCASSLFAQNNLSLRLQRQEVPVDPYVTPARETITTSPAYRFSSGIFTMTQANVDSAGNNIVGDAANEPSIAVDRNNPNRIAIGWRQFNTITNNFRQAGYAFTTDGGQAWTFPGVIEPGIFRSDPVLGSDTDGNFYYNSLTVSGPDFLCNVFKSTDGGASWDGGTFAQGGDKQWMVIDKTNGAGRGNIYSNWTSSFSVCSPGFFTRSTDGNMSYDSCVVIPDDPFWGTLDVGANSELYVAGAGNTDFVLAKSTTALDSAQTVTWDTTTVVDLGGQIVAFAGASSPNPSGLHGQTWVAVDHSAGPTSGNVYVVCSVRPDTGSDPLDVRFTCSTDGGLTWSAPVRINDDTTSAEWQWFGTMSVAPNGRIDVVWLDTRNNPGTVLSSLYYSYSIDAGVTWAPNIRLSNSFDPHVGWPQQQKMGDYYHMVSDNAGVHLAWAATFNGEQDVYYGHISLPVDVAEHSRNVPAEFSLLQNFPNPFNPSTTIQFALPRTGTTLLRVYNTLGMEVTTLVSGNLNAGTHTVNWDASGIPSGVYFYRLEAGEFSQTKKLILLR